MINVLRNERKIKGSNCSLHAPNEGNQNPNPLKRRHLADGIISEA